jgi:hypothetical protein
MTTRIKRLVLALTVAMVGAGIAYGVAATPGSGAPQPKQMTLGGAQSYINYLQRTATPESAQPTQLTIGGAPSYINYLRRRAAHA